MTITKRKSATIRALTRISPLKMKDIKYDNRPEHSPSKGECLTLIVLIPVVSLSVIFYLFDYVVNLLTI